jgi:hypothetical protein
MNAVSCSKQFPHIRQPNKGPLIAFSRAIKVLCPSVCFLKGINGGCHLRPGVKIGMVL